MAPQRAPGGAGWPGWRLRLPSVTRGALRTVDEAAHAILRVCAGVGAAHGGSGGAGCEKRGRRAQAGRRARSLWRAEGALDDETAGERRKTLRKAMAGGLDAWHITCFRAWVSRRRHWRSVARRDFIPPNEAAALELVQGCRRAVKTPRRRTEKRCWRWRPERRTHGSQAPLPKKRHSIVALDRQRQPCVSNANVTSGAIRPEPPPLARPRTRPPAARLSKARASAGLPRARRADQRPSERIGDRTRSPRPRDASRARHTTAPQQPSCLVALAAEAAALGETRPAARRLAQHRVAAAAEHHRLRVREHRRAAEQKRTRKSKTKASAKDASLGEPSLWGVPPRARNDAPRALRRSACEGAVCHSRK